LALHAKDKWALKTKNVDACMAPEFMPKGIFLTFLFLALQSDAQQSQGHAI
jgi:hypothetical protein